MAGFLGLEDLTHSRGELALVVQMDKKDFSIEAVTSLSDTSISSVQDAYLLASLSSVLPTFPRHKVLATVSMTRLFTVDLDRRE